jgi:hypothetical protein
MHDGNRRQRRHRAAHEKRCPIGGDPFPRRHLRALLFAMLALHFRDFRFLRGEEKANAPTVLYTKIPLPVNRFCRGNGGFGRKFLPKAPPFPLDGGGKT